MFAPAELCTSRAKIFLWGGSGTGKTTFALRWAQLGGKLAVIDLEASSRAYSKEFKFDRPSGDRIPTSIIEVKKMINWLSTTKHEYTTLLIDPVTVMWSMVQKYWEEKFLQTRIGKTGHHGDHYELQPRDWKLVTPYWETIFQDLNNLDMNVICTARAKVAYSGNDDMMKKVGETYDAQKNTDYAMDTTLHLEHRPETGQYIASVSKHRSWQKKMPPTIDITGGNMDYFIQFYGDAITRKAIPVVKVDEKTALEIQAKLDLLGVTEDKMYASLAKWGVNGIEDLPQKQAEEILEKLAEKAKSLSPF